MTLFMLFFSFICVFRIIHKLSAFAVFLFQGGPGMRGTRGDRGEPGMTVCDTYSDAVEMCFWTSPKQFPSLKMWMLLS